MVCFFIVIPVISADSAVVTAVLGSMATLVCTSVGEPIPEQFWTRNGLAVSGSRFQVSGDGRVLTISEVTLEDGGVYTCHASSVAGDDSAPVSLDVLCKYFTTHTCVQSSVYVHVCSHLCMYMCAVICVCTCVQSSVYVHVCSHLCMYMCAVICVCTCVQSSVYVHVSSHLCMYMCPVICVCTCVQSSVAVTGRKQTLFHCKEANLMLH